MKKLILLLFASLTLGCHKDDDPPILTPLQQLPPATQIGANTFGCLLDGVNFTPDGGSNSTNCFYQYVSGQYYFTIVAGRRESNGRVVSIAVKTEQRTIEQNVEYDLLSAEPGNAYGAYNSLLMANYTSAANTGKLKITKLDVNNFIVSGTFWFDVLDSNGMIHEIRDGRFDFHFTN